jgi:alpha-L-fucosidase
MDTINQVITSGPFEASWESLKQYSAPQWYMDAKFGIFIHWGIYSVPAFGNEWYPRNMYIRGTPEFEHHVKIYGPQDKFGYKDFIPLFKAERYDPAGWAALFTKAGARYVVPVAEHHDGFAMYDCSFSRWTAAKMGPKRDLVGELAAAVRKQGLVFGLSSHRAEHWFFMNGGRSFKSDVQDPRYEDFYGPACAYPDAQDSAAWKSLDWIPRPHAKHLEDWLARTCELVDKYQPQLVWFDWWIEQTVFQAYLQRFAAYYYNRGAEWKKGVAINYKNKSFPVEAAVYDIERGQLAGTNPHFWQTDTSISKNSWGYVSQQDYKTAESLVGDLVDIVSKNGTLLLNIGPRPDGTIPQEEEQVLLEIGEWLAVNGDAIYGTRPWKVYGEGPTAIPEGGFSDTQRATFTGKDFRFTTKDGALYAIALSWPGAEAKITSLGSGAARVSGVSLLGSPQQLNWSQDESGLKISLPAEKPCRYAYSFKVI